MQGRVAVDDKVVRKAGAATKSDAKVVVDADEPKYVCRGGLKLEHAFAHFGVDATGLIALDAGQSTGGFTDCLLQHGAAQVIGVDVGYGQLVESIRKDPRVTVIERLNLRHITRADVPCLAQLATLDLSFISVLLVMPALLRVLQPDAQLLVLIKPQFEAGKGQVTSGGVVKDPKVHAEVLARVTAGIESYGFQHRGTTESPIKGEKSGNTEFLAHFVRDPSKLVRASLEDVLDDESDMGTAMKPRSIRSTVQQAAAAAVPQVTSSISSRNVTSAGTVTSSSNSRSLHTAATSSKGSHVSLGTDDGGWGQSDTSSAVQREAEASDPDETVRLARRRHAERMAAEAASSSMFADVRRAAGRPVDAEGTQSVKLATLRHQH